MQKLAEQSEIREKWDYLLDFADYKVEGWICLYSFTVVKRESNWSMRSSLESAANKRVFDCSIKSQNYILDGFFKKNIYGIFSLLG